MRGFSPPPTTSYPHNLSRRHARFQKSQKQASLNRGGVWGFPDAPLEMCIRSERYDQEITLLHFEKNGPVYQQEEDEPEDTYDRFMNMGGPV